TGGTNGKSATTGKIGNNDLGPLIVEAQNIASGAVTPGKLAVNIGGGNLLRNSSFENYPDPNTPPPGWHMYASTSAARVAGRRGGYAMRVTFGGGAPTWGKGIGAVVGTNDAWLPGKTYVVSFWARGAFGPGSYAMTLRWNIDPASTVALSNPIPDATTWQRYVFRITCRTDTVEFGGAFWIAVDDYFLGGNVSGWAEFDDVQVEEGDVVTAYTPRPDEILPGTITQTEIADNSITTPKLAAGAVVAGSIAAGAVVADKLAADSVTAGKIAAGAIAAGSAAIADGAIINAMIADATIESAKIKSLSADKITAGRIAVGSYIASAGFNSGYSGWAIWGDGNAEFNNITVRNSTVTGTVYAGAGTIGGIRINAYQFNNDGYVPGTSGFALFSNGGAEFNQGCTFRGTLAVVSNSSGVRTEITNAGQQVFNGSNIAVIQLGVF
ncbi:MAG: carbohydrate binding domain-containing protein, partial [Aquincola sp.]|nr:carbohydrate binding domain-containing protein [Aquincola sp.]